MKKNNDRNYKALTSSLLGSLTTAELFMHFYYKMRSSVLSNVTSKWTRGIQSTAVEYFLGI